MTLIFSVTADESITHFIVLLPKRIPSPEENGLWNEVEDNRYQNFNGVFLSQYFAIFKLLQDINSAKQISKKHIMKQYQKEEITVLNMF